MNLLLLFLALEAVLDLVLKLLGDYLEIACMTLGISRGKDAPLINKLQFKKKTI